MKTATGNLNQSTPNSVLENNLNALHPNWPSTNNRSIFVLNLRTESTQ